MAKVSMVNRQIKREKLVQKFLKKREELKKSKGNTKVIPHNENRAVVFNSNLFHETDSYEFKEGYENRRINVTLLYVRTEDS